MPIYEYRCLDCAHQYEKREGFDAPALQQCPTCGGSARRVLHAPPIVFKGSGFYITDSRTSESAPEADTEAKVDTKDTKDSSDSGKDAEPAAAS